MVTLTDQMGSLAAPQNILYHGSDTVEHFNTMTKLGNRARCGRWKTSDGTVCTHQESNQKSTWGTTADEFHAGSKINKHSGMLWTKKGRYN